MPDDDDLQLREAGDMPSDARSQLSVFDRFATATSQWVSKAWFFTLCVLLVVLWVPSIAVLPSVDTWQLGDQHGHDDHHISACRVAAEYPVPGRQGSPTKAQCHRRRTCGSDGRIGDDHPNCGGIAVNWPTPGGIGTTRRLLSSLSLTKPRTRGRAASALSSAAPPFPSASSEVQFCSRPSYGGIARPVLLGRSFPRSLRRHPISTDRSSVDWRPRRPCRRAGRLCLLQGHRCRCRALPVRDCRTATCLGFDFAPWCPP